MRFSLPFQGMGLPIKMGGVDGRRSEPDLSRQWKRWGESHDSREHGVSRDGRVFLASELVSGMIPHRRWEIQAVFAKTMSQPSSRPISIRPPLLPLLRLGGKGILHPPIQPPWTRPPGSRIRGGRNRSARRAASSPLLRGQRKGFASAWHSEAGSEAGGRGRRQSSWVERGLRFARDSLDGKLKIDQLDCVATEQMKSNQVICEVIQQLPSFFDDGKGLIEACRQKTMQQIITT